MKTETEKEMNYIEKSRQDIRDAFDECKKEMEAAFEKFLGRMKS